MPYLRGDGIVFSVSYDIVCQRELLFVGHLAVHACPHLLLGGTIAGHGALQTFLTGGIYQRYGIHIALHACLEKDGRFYGHHLAGTPFFRPPTKVGSYGRMDDGIHRRHPVGIAEHERCEVTTVEPSVGRIGVGSGQCGNSCTDGGIVVHQTACLTVAVINGYAHHTQQPRNTGLAAADTSCDA